jgi:hypothetical protein
LYILEIKEPRYFVEKTKKYLMVPVKLSNNTNETLSYWSMTCAWQIKYLLDSKTIKWPTEGFECISDIPTVIKVPAHGSRIDSLKFEFADSNKLNVNFRVGIVLVKDIGKKGINYILHRHTDSVLIWSKRTKWRPAIGSY